MQKKIFTCKQFQIDDSRSALKIGSDGMMLGAWADTFLCNSILDIGTGSGLIALMQAQKNQNAQIIGIDIHEGSVLDAVDNAKNTKWNDRLSFICTDIKTYTFENRFDYIISNPPFFINSTKAKTDALTGAKHTDSLSPEDIIDLSTTMLSEKGKIAMILPFDLGNNLIEYAQKQQFFLSRKCIIYPVDYKKPNRLLFELTRHKPNKSLTEEIIHVRDSSKNNAFSNDYKTLLQDFMIRY